MTSTVLSLWKKKWAFSLSRVNSLNPRTSLLSLPRPHADLEALRCSFFTGSRSIDATFSPAHSLDRLIQVQRPALTDQLVDAFVNTLGVHQRGDGRGQHTLDT